MIAAKFNCAVLEVVVSPLDITTAALLPPTVVLVSDFCTTSGLWVATVSNTFVFVVPIPIVPLLLINNEEVASCKPLADPRQV